MKRFISFVFICLLVPSVFAGQWDGPTEKEKSNNNYFLYTGFQFDAILRTAVFSFNTITPVVAQTETDVTFLDKVMIPKGTKFIGSCTVVKSVDRVNITFNTMVFPNGQEIKFNGLALHTDGSGGVPGRVDKQKARLPAKVFLSAAATGASVAAPATSVPAEMIKGIAEDVNQEMNEKQDYSISIKKNTSIQIFIINRVEY